MLSSFDYDLGFDLFNYISSTLSVPYPDLFWETVFLKLVGGWFSKT